MKLSFFKNPYSILDYFFLIVWVRFTLLDYVRVVVSHLPIINSLSSLVIPFIMIVMILLSFKSILKRLKTFDFFVLLIIVILYLSSYILFPQNTVFLDGMAVPFFISSLPYFFIGKMINYAKVARPLYLLSVLSVLCFSFLYFTRFTSDDMGESGSGMHAAYQMLPFIIVIFCNAFKERNALSIIIGLFSFFMLLSFGNRGSVLYLLVYIVLCLLATLKSRRKFIIILVICTLATLLYIYFDIIILGLYEIMDNLGLSTRIFEKIIEGEISDSSGRDLLTHKLFNELNANPMGLGVGGDRLTIGIYAHNIFVELLVSFGYLLGGIICAILVLVMIIAYRKSLQSNTSLFYLATICFGFLPLLTSHSYLSYPNFWLFLGYTINILMMKSNNEI